MFLFKIFLFVLYFWHQICDQGPYVMRIDNLCLVGKMFKNISADSVRSGIFGCPVLSGQETHMPSLVEPYFGVLERQILLWQVSQKVMWQVPEPASFEKNLADIIRLFTAEPARVERNLPEIRETCHANSFTLVARITVWSWISMVVGQFTQNWCTCGPK